MPSNIPEQPYDVFVSYSHADVVWVRDNLVPRLKAEGLKVCIDSEAFDIGVPSLVNMENAVAASRHTLLVLTPNWIRSEWTAFEHLLSRHTDLSGIRQHTIPVLRESSDVPSSIATLSYADLRGEVINEVEWSKILDVLRGTRRLPDAPHTWIGSRSNRVSHNSYALEREHSKLAPSDSHGFDYDVFISYSSKDATWVRGEMLTRLEAEGLRVCIDFRNFVPGTAIVKELERAILTSRHTLVVLTPNYLQSEWATFETLVVQTLNPANQYRRLIPLLKEQCEIPLRLRTLTNIDFTDPHKQAFAWGRLIVAFGLPLDELDDPSNKPENRTKRNMVFISYSHNDRRWLKRLQIHLKPLERLGVIELWDDTKIIAGTNWREEIRKAIELAKVAVLLVSADFLASEFISTDELPPLLAKAKETGTVVLPVIVSPCRFEHTKGLSQFQAVNSPARSLILLPKGRQEDILVKVSEMIENCLREV